MAYKAVTRDNNKQYWFVETDAKGNAQGPVITFYKKWYDKRIGVIKDNHHIFQLDIMDEEGSEYRLSLHKKDYQQHGPVLHVKNGVARFGYYDEVCGFNGPVYVFEKGKKTILQEYRAGFLEKQGEIDYVIEDDIFINLPFNFSTSEDINTKEFVGHEGQTTYLYTTGEKSDGNVNLGCLYGHDSVSTIGQFRGNGFHGLTMKVINYNELIIFRKFENGQMNKDFQITYSKKNDGVSFLNKNNDGETYTDLFFSGKDEKYEMGVATLSKHRKPIGGFKYLPTKVSKIPVSKPITKRSKKQTAEERLNSLVGLENVKKQVKRMRAFFIKNKGNDNLNLNMVFTGNPGTGKTVVARLIADILFDIGILPTNKLIETDRSGLVAEYIGQTEAKVNDVLKEAMGGVLFIDEAYSLFAGHGNDYGYRVVDILNKALEDNRGKLCVIFAGYKEPMERMLEMNQGFKSRFNRFIDFPTYTAEELRSIASIMLKDTGYKCTKKALDEVIKICECKREEENFANAREVRNILESLYDIQSVRTIDDLKNMTVTFDDVVQYEGENNIHIKDQKITREWIVNALWMEETSKAAIKKPVEVTNDYLEDRTVSIKTDKGEGTGFFVSNMGIIGTCAHVVEGAKTISVLVTIFTRNGQKLTKEYEAEVIDKDTINDVAIIGIVKREIGYESFPLMEQNYLPNCGDEIIMSGYPFGRQRLAQISFNEGKVQSINKDRLLEDEQKDVTRIYVDMSGHPGNSGSPVVDKKTAAVIGIYAGASITTRGIVVNQIHFAIPVKPLWDLIYKNKWSLEYGNN